MGKRRKRTFVSIADKNKGKGKIIPAAQSRTNPIKGKGPA